MIRIGLWSKEANGRKFMSGKNDYCLIPPNASIAVFRNDQKKSDREPDYHLVIKEPYQPTAERPAPAAAAPAANSEAPAGAEIPF